MSDPVVPEAGADQSAAIRRVRMFGTQRREQVIAVGRQLFAERGFDATSMEEVAARAKVSKPVVYEHFGNKDGLYAVVVDREARGLLDRVAAALTDGHPRQMLEQAALALLDYVEEETDGFRVLVQEAPVMSQTGNFSSVLNDVAHRVEHILGAEFKTRGYDPKLAELYSQALVGMVGLVGRWWLDVRKPRKARVAAHMVNLAWNGLSHLEHRPALETRSRSSNPAEVSAPQSEERYPPDETAALVDQVRSVVVQALAQGAIQGELVAEPDRTVRLRVGTAVVFVRVRKRPLVVEVYSPILTDVAPSEELYRELSELTSYLAVGRVYHANNTVWASVQVVGSDFQRSHLILALKVMTGLVNDLDDRLQSAFGGRRFFAEDGSPSGDSDPVNPDGRSGAAVDDVPDDGPNHLTDIEDLSLPEGWAAPGTINLITVDAYLDTDERVVAQQVLDALDDIAKLLGYEGPVEEQWLDGSIWRRAKATRKSGRTSDELRQRLVKLERAIELRYVEARQAETDAKMSEAVDRLIKRLHDVPQACLRVGSILIVKYHDDRDGTPVLLTRSLSQLEIRALERYPEIQTKPRAALEALAAVIATLTPIDREDEVA